LPPHWAQRREREPDGAAASPRRLRSEAAGSNFWRSTHYYLAYIALDPGDIRADDLTLTAGLPAAVNIRTKDRSVLDYLFAPLFDAFSSAGREE